MKKLATLIAGTGLLGLFGCTATVTSDDEVSASEQPYTWGSCDARDGRTPTLAALAVAMADELGRWDPVADLQYAGSAYWGPDIYHIGLNPDASCSNGCEKTKALLALQTDHAYDSFVGGQWVFNTDGFRSAMWAGYERQMNNNINRPYPAHKLTRVAGPTKSYACGSDYPTYDYTYKVTKPDGGELSWSEAEELHRALCFFQEGPCGNNDFIQFKVGDTLPGCEPGDVCVSVDPTDGDSGTTATTTASGIASFTLNRLFNPRNLRIHSRGLYRAGEKCAMLGTYEVTTLKKIGLFNFCKK